MSPMKRKPVLVQFDLDLLKRLDDFGAEVHRSRSALVRDAVERYILSESEGEKDRRLIEGYRKIPDSGEFDAAAEEGARRLVEEEPW